MTFTETPISATEGRGAASAVSGYPVPETQENVPAPLPDSLEGTSGIELTKKGEAYAAAHEALPDINLRELFGEPEKRLAFVEADGVFFLTLCNDRATVAYTIDRLIGMLDAMEPDPDIEPWLGASENHPTRTWSITADDSGSQLENWSQAGDDREGEHDERELDNADYEPWLGAPERHPGDSGYGRENKALRATHTQVHWAEGERYEEDREEQCEDEGAQCEDEGACIQSQPHDAHDEGNDEPFLGWPEKCGQGPKIGIDASPADFCYVPQEYSDSGPLHFDGEGVDAARKVLRNLRTARPDVPQDYVGGFFSGDPNALKVEGLSIKSNKGGERLGLDELTILRPGVAMIGGYRETPVMRAVASSDDGLIPEIDTLTQWRAAHTR